MSEHEDIAHTGFFEALEEAFNAAMVSNDVDRIARCVWDEWCLVTPEKGPVGRAAILGAIAAGVLTHDTMTKTVARVKVYGAVAVVTGRGRNTGTFRGEPMRADEWVTDIYVRRDGEWRCVLTHLTPVSDGDGGDG